MQHAIHYRHRDRDWNQRKNTNDDLSLEKYEKKSFELCELNLDKVRQIARASNRAIVVMSMAKKIKFVQKNLRINLKKQNTYMLLQHCRAEEFPTTTKKLKTVKLIFFVCFTSLSEKAMRNWVLFWSFFVDVDVDDDDASDCHNARY